MSAALISPEQINLAHDEVMDKGWRLLQPFRFAKTDEDHIAFLLEVAGFPQGARVLDVGCGVGECARLMKLARPDLSFTLLNFSEAQLADCPDGFETILADAHSLPFEAGAFDAVMFNAALGNMDCMVALAEASRVLKPEGVLFLNELERSAGDNEEIERALKFRAYDSQQLCAFAKAIGLSGAEVVRPTIESAYLRDKMDAELYECAMFGVRPALWRFAKEAETPIAAQHGAAFHRHERIALQVSGGKDSLTVLYAMRPWWDRLCVYWSNPGNPFPETVALMVKIKAVAPFFVEIAGRQREIVAKDGWPSDVVPQAYTTEGNFVFGATPFKVQTRLSCCFRSLMLPMHERMIADGVTCIIRGKRHEEKDKTETRTGSVLMGIETIYPLWDWREDEVLNYLSENGIELPESYQHATHSLDCMDCTAWWGEGLSHYLKAKHPEHHKEYVRRITLIKTAISDQMADCEV